MVEKVVEKLSPNQEIIVSLIKKNPKISKREIQKESNLGKKAVDYNIEILKKNGIIKRTGPAKGGQWEVTD
ncbi:MAG: winged helix-turn-helix transcriptional regulator [Candidatus Thermoplasmatota archaeon]|nr:winged helix-turn-helix transcriptional regulator [Candidatus Thermoplasmatota archaeon]